VKIIGIWLLAILGLIGLYYLLSFIALMNEFSSDDITNDQVFKQEIWKKGNYRERGRMVIYLIDSIGVVGKSRKEIVNLLGKPERELTNGNGITYSVDMGDMYGYDMWLFLDSTDQVTSIMFDD